MNAIQDDERAQEKGIIVIGYHIGSTKVDAKFLEVMKHIRILTDAIPIRTAAVHLCYDNPHLRPVVLLIQNALNKDHRLRFRAHYGT